ncbi:MAG: EAL domain-containing protein [Sphingomonadales bacterium]|nr:EAL domain-containing protein [Sphingomonadales bacterium]MBL0001171.1 EAL domain-containing protein [Sphingomonadales bacterium]
MVSKKERLYAVIPAGLEDWVANRLVRAHIRILAALVLGHLLNAVVVAVAFYGRVPSISLVLGCMAVAIVGAHRYWLGQSERKRFSRIGSQAMVWQLEANTLALALIASGSLVALMPYGGAAHQLMLAVVGMSLIGAAGYTMRTLPRAAIGYIAIISVGLMAALLGTGTVVAIATCILILATSLLLCRMALTAYSLFVVRIVRERERNSSIETVKMLLNDFEDQGSDWLFEVDRDRRILGASKHFSDETGLAPENLNGRLFENLFQVGPECAQLVDHLVNRRAFRGLALQLAQEDGKAPRWWSVSARPATGGTRDGVCFRGVISDVSAEKQAEARVRHMAHYDALTGLPNRLMFNNALSRMVADEMASQRLVVLLIDVDHFKVVNDTLGHPIGDQFLRAVSSRLIEGVTKSGLGGEGHILARLGGDEFAVMMAGEDSADHAIRLAQKLVTKMAEPFLVSGHQIMSGVSIGIAIAPFDGQTAEALQRNADLALYCAKDSGRGCWERFENGMDVAVRERHAMERDLRNALAADEMRLFFQPLVDVSTGKQSGFEALIRWESAARGLVMPDEFIPLAEETGLIVPLGEWVIRAAMAEAARWTEPLTIAVNVSPVQMRSPGLLPTIMNSLAETGLDPARFEVEITEGVLLHESEANMAVLHRMRDLGIKVALDDFGTGYSSLNYLRTFPFDKIKIDRSFVNDLENREDCRAIVSAVIGLANNLGMVTLAEGVEDAAQLEQLRQEGCSMVQGYLFGKAMPAGHYTDSEPRDVPAAEAVARIEPVQPSGERKVA